MGMANEKKQPVASVHAPYQTLTEVHVNKGSFPFSLLLTS